MPDGAILIGEDSFECTEDIIITNSIYNAGVFDKKRIVLPIPKNTVALVLVMVVVLLAAGWGSLSFPAPLTLFNSYNHTPYFMTGILKRESFQHE